MSDPTLRFLQPSRLGHPGSLEAIIEIILKQDFRIYHMYIEPLVIELMKWRPTAEGVREELAIAYERGKLSFAVIDTARAHHLQLQFHLRWDKDASNQPMNQHLYGSVFRPAGALFTRNQFDPEYYAQRLLDLGKELYLVLHPTFAWIERCRTRGYTKEKDLNALTVPHIYWANIFSPAYVAKLGEEFLLTAPAGKTEQLEDGGILYVLTPKLSPNRLPKSVEVAVKNHFGVESIRCKTG